MKMSVVALQKLVDAVKASPEFHPDRNDFIKFAEARIENTYKVMAVAKETIEVDVPPRYLDCLGAVL